MTILDAAIEAAVTHGWYVFPLLVGHNSGACDGGEANCKTIEPLVAWRLGSSNDPDVIRAQGNWDKANGYGIDCYQSGLAVVDVDPGTSWDGPATRVHSTGRGQHHLYEDIIGVANAVDVAPWHVDVRGEGGMIVGPGSWHPHGDYSVIEDVDPVMVPMNLVEALGVSSRDPATIGSTSEIPAFQARSRLNGVYDRMRHTLEGRRNNALNVLAGLAAGIWSRIPEADRVGPLTEEAVRLELSVAAQDAGLPADEVRATLARGWQWGLDRPISDRPEVLTELFSSSPILQHIQQAAYARLVSSSALLCWVLGRVLAEIPPCVMLPSVIGSDAPLNLGFALVGPSGAGKSVLMRVSAELLDGVDQQELQIGPGSGEGLIEAYLEAVPGTKNKTLIAKPSRILEVDEIDRLGAVNERRGSTMFPLIRTAMSGGALKTNNATADRTRSVEDGSYRLVAFVGVQPERSGTLLNDANAGTPQRFVWASVIDSTLPEAIVEWPGPLDWKLPSTFNTWGNSISTIYIDYPEEVKAEVRRTRWEVIQGMSEDPLESHKLLTRLKLAAAFAILHGQTKITKLWWDAAKLLSDHSFEVQKMCLDELEKARTAQVRAKGKETAIQTEAMEYELGEREEQARLKVRERALEILAESNGNGLQWTDLSRRINTSIRKSFTPAMEELEEEGLIKIEEVKTAARPKRIIHLLPNGGE
jgi:hypothetical protein